MVMELKYIPPYDRKDGKGQLRKKPRPFFSSVYKQKIINDVFNRFDLSGTYNEFHDSVFQLQK